VYAGDHGQPFVYDDWHHDVLRMTLPREYDEERRLLYVAITRAQDHLLLSAGENPNQFLEELPVELATVEPDVEPGGPGGTEQAHLQITVPEASGPRSETPHTIMDDSVFEGDTGGLGSEFGDRVHDFAEDYVRGRVSSPPAMDEPDCDNVAEFIEDCEGQLFVEHPVHLHLDVAGESVTINGVVDLVTITEDRVAVIDYKTDRGRHAESEYEIQLSIYHHVLSDAYPDRAVNSSIYYTADDESIDIDPLEIHEIEDVVATRWSR
jgi:ATP-dependent exoDNAse (exonuclease V) beta subunit